MDDEKLQIQRFVRRKILGGFLPEEIFKSVYQDLFKEKDEVDLKFLTSRLNGLDICEDEELSAKVRFKF
jgi:hypothetical protein